MKTPEEYFQENVRLPGEEKGGDLSSAERAFVEKYMGMGGASELEGMPRLDPRREDSLPGFAAVAGADAPPEEPSPDEPSLEEQLKNESELQLVSFVVGEQEFAVPIMTIQEVIRAVAPTRLPRAPEFVEGIVNLRGRVTPLVSMRSLMGVHGGDEDKFIIVCRRSGMQVGLIVTSVKTMYRATQDIIEWGIESSVGISAQLLAGLMKKDGRLINIISVDRLVTHVLAK
ncbi:chemotaxis protein CheW [Desulfohalovibrio reitneri]|uniref:chemotaxis protein CheW n=1 Tax=Desulfohalovibrio reitneri TaxID=1307759 RepID=UPI0004A771DA|nr:chemotaxis protein CheW [Desulfohalovibrio reitneri]